MLYCRWRGTRKYDGDSKMIKMLDMKTEINESNMHTYRCP